MKPTALLRAALSHKIASASCAAAPETNAPAVAKEAPSNPEHFSAGQHKADPKKAPKSVKRASVVLDFLEKTAGIAKTAAPRPGRLDGDQTLDKLAKLHSKRKK